VRVVIVGGGGGVGSSVAFNLLRSGLEADVALVDVREQMVTSHVMDLEQAALQDARRAARAGTWEDVPGADVVVVCAAAPLTVNESRLAYLDANAEILDELAPRLGDFGGLVLVITNPVDPLVTRLARNMGGDRRRVLGYTLNDSLRLRSGIARALGVPASDVEAWVLGEHGDGAVPLLDRVRVAGAPVALDAAQRELATAFLRDWYRRHVVLDSGRSSTWTSGLGVARMVAATANGRGELWPASVVLRGEYGVDGVAISVPVTLGPGGAEEIHEWTLSPAELRDLHRAAESVRALTG
jgi:malate dehydrogenase